MECSDQEVFSFVKNEKSSPCFRTFNFSVVISDFDIDNAIFPPVIGSHFKFNGLLVIIEVIFNAVISS